MEDSAGNERKSCDKCVILWVSSQRIEGLLFLWYVDVNLKVTKKVVTVSVSATFS